VMAVRDLDHHAAAFEPFVALRQRLGPLANPRFLGRSAAHVPEHNVDWQHPMLLAARRAGRGSF
jgi:hypothetical protein